MARGKLWTQEENARLWEMVEQRMETTEIAAILERSPSSVQTRISAQGGRQELKPARSGQWNAADRELAGLMLALGMSHAQVGAVVNRSEGTIAAQLCRGRITIAADVSKLDLKQGDRRPWSEDEDTLMELLSRRDWTPSKIAR